MLDLRSDLKAIYEVALEAVHPSRVLKKKLQEDGLFNELRKREFFQSRGEKKRRARAAGKRRAQKETKKRLEEFGF
mgnify:CR=1 FL=1